MKKMKTYNQFNESVRDLMKPKSKKEIGQAKKDIIKFIIGVVTENDERITMGDLEADSPPVYKNENHIIEELCEDSVTVVVYDGLDDEKEYYVKYEDLKPETLVEIKELLEDGIDDELIKGKINESVRDLMKPKSKEEIEKALEGIMPVDLLKKLVVIHILYDNFLLRVCSKNAHSFEVNSKLNSSVSYASFKDLNSSFP